MAVDNARSTVVGVFEHRDQAEAAISELHSAGFDDSQIGIATRGGTGTGDAATGETGGATAEGAGHGLVTGALTGGIVGALASLLIPGVGPVLAGGILAATLGGAALGAATGTLLGALVKLGVPEEDAQYYEGEFQSGRTIVTVRANGKQAEAENILRRYGAYDVNNRRSSGTQGAIPMGASTTANTTMGMPQGRAMETERSMPAHQHTSGEQTVQLREEELRANKQSVQAGQVEIRKEVVSEQRTIDVPVTREEVVIERRPVEHRAAQGRIGEETETIRVPLREEQVTVEKVPVVTEEISVGKRTVQETQQVSGTVRHEEARVENQGTARGQRSGDWGAARSRYQNAWQQKFGTKGGRWEDVEPSYRYGHEMSSNPRYQGRQWSDVESDLRSDWGTRHRETPWDRVKDSVRHAWETATGRV